MNRSVFWQIGWSIRVFSLIDFHQLSEFMSATRKFARLNKPPNNQFKKIEELFDVDPVWMHKLLERLLFLFQYISESVLEENWKELRANKGVDAMWATLSFLLFKSSVIRVIFILILSHLWLLLPPFFSLSFISFVHSLNECCAFIFAWEKREETRGRNHRP